MSFHDKLNLAIFASGNGSNAINIINLAKKEFSDFFQICCLIVDQEDSPIIQKMNKNYLDIPCALFLPRDFSTKKNFEESIVSYLEKFNIEFIFLAGYMRLLGNTLLNFSNTKPGNKRKIFKYPIVNLHPSLLPDFPGLRGIEQGLRNNVPELGITLHLVDEGMDTGRILLQERFLLSGFENEENIYNKIKSIEHSLYFDLMGMLREIWVRNNES